MGIGATLKDLLKNNGMTAKELSKRTGISINTIYAILKRDNDSIKPESLMKISEVLNVDPNYILGISKSSRIESPDFNHKIFLINEWLERSDFQIINEYNSAIYTIRDKKRNIGLYVSSNDIEELYSEIKSSCEYVIDKFIFKQLKEE